MGQLISKLVHMQDTTFDKKKKIKEAQAHLRASKSEKEMKIDKGAILQLAKEFQNNSIFSYARRLFQLLHEYFPNDEEVTQRLAVSTYKDTDLSSEVKYDAAAKLLIAHFEKNGKITNPNVLGLMGSIYKKKWKYDNHAGHLYQSLRYYLEGFKRAKGAGGEGVTYIGYNGINLALLYDLLAGLEVFQIKNDQVGFSTEFEEDPFAKVTEGYMEEAKKCRQEIRTIYAKQYEVYLEKWKTDKKHKEDFDRSTRYWYFVTWAEACLGLGEMEEAGEQFARAVEMGGTPGWMLHSTRVQCYELIEMLYGEDAAMFDRGKKALNPLLQGAELSPYHSVKFGLALSGGGFRASLFHIGVLAKLAEADLLRKVEVISCVSGGSILGAYYYLKLKNMLESNPKENMLGKDDYIKLVKELEDEFLDKVNKNVRLNLLANLGANLKMALPGKYTRSSRTADLYDKFLYNDLNGGKKTYMQDLIIRPSGNKDFRPDRDNWKTENKVPILILNATTLNTGHSWQFTASWMGESPAYIDSEFDALPNLRRMYYGEAPGKYRKIPLSTAVVASAGVPGLFAPIEFDDLYEDYKKVLLVDGGVHDNQGISTLYEQECNMLIISDASGQMPAVKTPPNGEVGVFGRTNSILQERIRASQFNDLKAMKQSGVVRDFMLMHLTKGLPADVVNWRNCDDPYVPPVSHGSGNGTDAVMTDYLIRKKIQTLLASIRTDLDAFHDSEARALMYSGYKMAAHEIKLASSKMFNAEIVPPEEGFSWKFLQLEKVHEDSELSRQLEEKLKPSSSLFGKVFLLSKKAKYGAWAVLALLGAALVVALPIFFPTTLQLATLWPYAVAVVVAIFIERRLSKLFQVKSIVLSLFIWVPVLVLLWGVSYLVSLVSTRWYLGVGRLPG